MRSVPNAGSKRGSSAQSEVRRQKRVRRVSIVGVCATSSPTLPTGLLESTAAWLCLVQKIRHAHSMRA